jgi:hypothetical protein
MFKKTFLSYTEQFIKCIQEQLVFRGNFKKSLDERNKKIQIAAHLLRGAKKQAQSNPIKIVKLVCVAIKVNVSLLLFMWRREAAGETDLAHSNGYN